MAHPLDNCPIGPAGHCRNCAEGCAAFMYNGQIDGVNMKKPFRYKISICFLVSFLTIASACSARISQTETPTPKPSQTSMVAPTRLPTATMTAAPIPTHPPTLAPSPIPTFAPTLTGTTTPEILRALSPAEIPLSLKGFGLLSQKDPGVLYYYTTGKPGWASLKTPDSLSVEGIIANKAGDWIALHLVKDMSTQTGHTLDLLHLTDNQFIQVARMDSDWPNPQAEKVKQVEMLLGDARILWSPDGRSLAFPAAMDGSLNTDVYLAQTTSPDLIRLTDQPLNVKLLAWTPDSRQVIYSVSTGWDGMCYADTSVWSVSLDAKARKLYSAGCFMGEEVLGFTQADQMITCTESSSGPSYLLHLRRVDLSIGQTRMLYTGAFYQAAIDPVHGKVLFNALKIEDGDLYNLNEAAYDWVSISNPDQLHKLPITIATDSPNSVMPHSITWLPDVGRFMVVENGCLLVQSDGTITQFPQETFQPLGSPDGSRLAFIGMQDNPGIRVYDLAGKLQRTITSELAGVYAWSHDGKGLFYFSIAYGAYLTLYYQDLSKDKADLLVQDFLVGMLTLIY